MEINYAELRLIKMTQTQNKTNNTLTKIFIPNIYKYIVSQCC